MWMWLCDTQYMGGGALVPSNTFNDMIPSNKKHILKYLLLNIWYIKFLVYA